MTPSGAEFDRPSQRGVPSRGAIGIQALGVDPADSPEQAERRVAELGYGLTK